MRAEFYLQAVYLPPALLSFLMLLAPRADVLFYICMLFSFVLGVMLTLGAIAQRRILAGLVGGIWNTHYCSLLCNCPGP